jgi:hypothetical protein
MLLSEGILSSADSVTILTPRLTSYTTWVRNLDNRSNEVTVLTLAGLLEEKVFLIWNWCYGIVDAEIS